MTTIVAARGSNGVIFGSDSQVSGAGMYDSLANSKIVKNGTYTIGVAGILPALQAIQFARLPQPKRGVEYDRFVKTTLLPAVQELEKKEGLKPGSSMYLFSFYDQIYILNGANYFLNSRHAFNAIGSGGQYARAYLLGLGKDVFTENDVLQALTAAAGVDSNSSGPFYVQKATK